MKKKKPIVKRTTQPRPGRLHLAKEWMKTYTGKNLVRGYAKKYRVYLLCAITELRLLGLDITTEYEEAVRRTVTEKIEQNRKKKEAKEYQQGLDGHQDLDFAFIAGYTSCGLPYGITWDEMEDLADTEE